MRDLDFANFGSLPGWVGTPNAKVHDNDIVLASAIRKL